MHRRDSTSETKRNPQALATPPFALRFSPVGTSAALLLMLSAVRVLRR